MKNTIPLSIAFIDSRYINTSGHEALDDNHPTTSPPSQPQYALEVNQGFFEERGVRVGDRVELP